MDNHFQTVTALPLTLRNHSMIMLITDFDYFRIIAFQA
jgi:hypothetical protein